EIVLIPEYFNTKNSSCVDCRAILQSNCLIAAKRGIVFKSEFRHDAGTVHGDSLVERVSATRIADADELHIVIARLIEVVSRILQQGVVRIVGSSIRIAKVPFPSGYRTCTDAGSILQQ